MRYIDIDTCFKFNDECRVPDADTNYLLIYFSESAAETSVPTSEPSTAPTETTTSNETATSSVATTTGMFVKISLMKLKDKINDKFLNGFKLFLDFHQWCCITISK